MRLNKIVVLLFFVFAVKTFAQNNYSLPAQSPFTHHVGINFNVLFTNWLQDPSIMYDADKKNKCATDRLTQITKRFKLVRIYSFLIGGFESTGTLDPDAAALMNVINNDKDVEAVIGTSNDKAWLLNSDNVDTWVSKLKDQLGDNVSQVKCILIGNEVNANGYSPDDIKTIMENFKSALGDINIPVSFSVTNLAPQAGGNTEEALVQVLVNNWDAKWNGGFPFVFIDPYPDAPGIGSPAGVFDWQSRVTKYYQTKYPKLQIFIGETGGEGSANDAAELPIINGLLSQLDAQYQAHGKTVPTFLMEALDEPRKSGSPAQGNMGIFKDSNDPMGGSSISIKAGINVPAWIK
jgi:hypothetical protein